jgi:uncharacterized protein YjbJ (UPF0337 family)
MKELINTSENWADFSTRLRDRFSKLTADDVAFKDGREEETIARIQNRLGWTRMQVISLFEKMRLPGTALS